MDISYKRLLLFLVGCIGTRALFVYIAKISSIQTLKYLGYLAILPTVGFMYIYLTGARQTGIEVDGGKIWWNNLRPVHSLFYGLFAYNAIIGNANAWMYLFVDVLFGLTSFIVHHFT